MQQQEIETPRQYVVHSLQFSLNEARGEIEWHKRECKRHERMLEEILKDIEETMKELASEDDE